jgi:hypothetical protein
MADAGSGLLQLGNSGLCLSTPVPTTYTQVCGRINTFPTVEIGQAAAAQRRRPGIGKIGAGSSIPGYCLQAGLGGLPTISRLFS